MAKDGFGEILTIGLVLGGGWLAYQFLIAPAIAAAAAPPATTPPATPPATPPTTTPSTPPPPSGAGPCPMPNLPSAMGGGSGCPPTTDSLTQQQAKVATAAGASATSSQTASVWNWYYNQAYNLPQTVAWLLGDNGQPMTLADYIALRHTVGFSGYSGRGGLSGYAGLGWGPARPRMGSNYIAVGTPMAPVKNYVRRNF
jgi:hypothetical protein